MPQFVREWVQYDVPQAYRFFDKEENAGYWCIHRKYLLSVIELGYKQLGHVDYSSLDDYIQIEVAQAKEGWKVNQHQNSKRPQAKPSHSMVLRDAYTILHLLPSAPSSTVSAVWRSLARVSHPDQGGDAETFRRYSEAYSLIKEEEK
jgi:hypothetical protein